MCELAGMEDVWLADLPSLWPGRDTVVQCRSSWKFECVWNWNSFVCYWIVLNAIEYRQPNIESDGITGMLEEVVPGLCRHLIGSQGARCLGVSLWQPYFALPMSSLLLKTKACKTGRGCGFPLLFNARAALQSPWLGRATAAQAEWHRGYWAYNLIRQDASNKWKLKFQDVSIHASFWRISLKGIQQTCGVTWRRHLVLVGDMPRFSMHSSWDNLGTKTFQCVRLSVIYSNLFEFSWLSPFCKHWIHPKNCPGRRDNSDNSCFCFIHAGRLHCQCPASQWKQSQKTSHSCNLLCH